RLLERQISEAEKWRDRLVQQITSRLTIGPGAAARNQSNAMPAEPVLAAAGEAPMSEPVTDAAVMTSEAAITEAAAAEPVSSDAAPAPIANRFEGVAAVWDQLSRTDIERVKRE